MSALLAVSDIAAKDHFGDDALPNAAFLGPERAVCIKALLPHAGACQRLLGFQATGHGRPALHGGAGWPKAAMALDVLLDTLGSERPPSIEAV